MPADKLAAKEVQATIDRLYKRIDDRFPDWPVCVCGCMRYRWK
ncbi:hypothetical protein ACFL6U_14105 [Planctomycetota bacterium]